ncbi:MAG: hypothetical protein KBF96_09090 [Ignavibacteria bacterium]|jgi:hypothetical protein|nr:hypothetical protein [Ignavibacteria bacterium]
MELTIKIENKYKLTKVRTFLEENSIEIVKEETNNDNKVVKDNVKPLIQFLKNIKIDLPDNYKFDREEANER